MKTYLLAILLTIGCSSTDSAGLPPVGATDAGLTPDMRDVGLVACGEPGTTKACKCDDGRSGEAVCRATGELGACVCTGTPPDGGVDTAPAIDANADAPTLTEEERCKTRPGRLEWRAVDAVCFDLSLKLRCRFFAVKVFGLRCVPIESHVAGYLRSECAGTLLDTKTDPMESHARLGDEVYTTVTVTPKPWFVPITEAGTICGVGAEPFPFTNASGKAAQLGVKLEFGEVAALFAAPG